MNPNSPAFPRLYPRSDEDGTQGMSIRLYIATHAMQGLLAFPLMTNVEPYQRVQTFDEIARQALAAADALILDDEKNH